MRSSQPTPTRHALVPSQPHAPVARLEGPRTTAVQATTASGSISHISLSLEDGPRGGSPLATPLLPPVRQSPAAQVACRDLALVQTPVLALSRVVTTSDPEEDQAAPTPLVVAISAPPEEDLTVPTLLADATITPETVQANPDPKPGQRPLLSAVGPTAVLAHADPTSRSPTDPSTALALHGNITSDGLTHASPPRGAPSPNPSHRCMAESRHQSPPAPSEIQAFFNSVRATTHPLLPTPAPRRKRLAAPLNFTPRHSSRIAKNDRGLDSESKAKRILLRRLGLVAEDEPISPEVLDRYYKLFQEPLTHNVVQAFTDFHGWKVPAELLGRLVTTTA